MQQLKTAIKDMLKEAGIDKTVSQQSALFLWEEIVGEKIAEKARATDVKHNVLMVQVDTPTWRQELQFQKKDILFKLNKRLGSGTIKDIRFL